MDTISLLFYTRLLKSTYNPRGPIQIAYKFPQYIINEMNDKGAIGDHLLTDDKKPKPEHNIRICRLICITRLYELRQIEINR